MSFNNAIIQFFSIYICLGIKFELKKFVLNESTHIVGFNCEI